MNFRKLATLLLASALLCTCGISMTVSAAINFMPAADFEDEAAFKAAWNTDMQVWDTNISIVQDPDGQREGKVLSIAGNTDTSRHGVWLNAEHQDGFVPGQKYQVSFWIKFDKNTTKDSASMSFYPKKDGNYVSELRQYLEAYTGSPVFTTASSTISYVKGNWTKVEAVFTMPEGANQVEISIAYTGKGNSGDIVYIDDFKVMGTKAPKIEEEIFKNLAPEMTEWELSESGAKLENDSSVLTVSGAGAFGKAIVDIKGGEAYVIEADAYATKDRDIRVSIDTQGVAGVDITNQTADPYFYNNAVDYAYILGCNANAYGHIKLTVYTARTAAKLVIGLETTDGAVSYKNFSVKKTRELLTNGDFEALPVLEKEVIGGGNINDVPGWIFDADHKEYASIRYGSDFSANPLWSGTAVEISNYNMNGDSKKPSEQSNQVVFNHMIPVRPGKTYKVTGSIYANLVKRESDGAVIGGPMLYFLNTDNGYSENLDMLTETNYGWSSFTKYFKVPFAFGDKEEPGDLNLSIRLGYSAQLATNFFYMLDNLSLTEVETGARFYNDEGERLEELGTDGQDVHTYFDYYAMEAGEEGMLVVALYNTALGKPCLENVVFKGFEAETRGVISVYTSIGVPAKDNYRVAAFLIDSAGSLRALEHKYTIE